MQINKKKVTLLCFDLWKEFGQRVYSAPKMRNLKLKGDIFCLILFDL